MIEKIVSGFIKLVAQLGALFAAPIDAIISAYIPDLSSALASVATFLQLCVSCIGWVLSAFGIPSVVVSLLVVYYTFSLTVPLLVRTTKVIVKWYHYLVP